MVRVLHIPAITRVINKVYSIPRHIASVIDSLSAWDTMISQSEGLACVRGLAEIHHGNVLAETLLCEYSLILEAEVTLKKQQNGISVFALYLYHCNWQNRGKPSPPGVLFLELIWVTFGLTISRPWIHWGLDKCGVLVLMCIYDTQCNCSFGAVNAFL